MLHFELLLWRSNCLSRTWQHTANLHGNPFCLGQAAYTCKLVVAKWQLVTGNNTVCDICVWNRKAFKEESKDVIDNAFPVARATCMQEHCARRNLAQQSLVQFLVLMKTEMDQLPCNLQNIMAVLTYAKCEVLWYFRNVNEVKNSSLCPQPQNVIDLVPIDTESSAVHRASLYPDSDANSHS